MEAILDIESSFLFTGWRDNKVEDVAIVLFNFFLLKNLSSVTSSSKMKIVVTPPPESSSFQTEAIGAITPGPYYGDKDVRSTNLVLGTCDMGSDLSFELVIS